MPLLYEPLRVEVKQLRRKYQPKALQVTEAPRWRVKEEWAMNSIYLTVDQASSIIKSNLEKACREKGATLEYYEIEKAWAIWRVFWTEYHVIYTAIIKGSPIGWAAVVAILGIAAVGIIIVVGIWLVATLIIEPIFEAVPPELKPVLGVSIIALLFGGAIFITGLGIYYIRRKK